MDPTMIGLIILMVAVFYFLMIRPQQKKQKEQQAMQRSLGPGSTVMLASGVYGEIVDSSGKDTSVVRIADGVEITVLKQAIVKEVPAADFPGASNPGEVEDTDEPTGTPDEIAGATDSTERPYGENLTGADGSSSGYDAPGSATRPRGADGQTGSSALGGTGAGSTGAGSTDDSTGADASDDENPNNPKA